MPLCRASPLLPLLLCVAAAPALAQTLAQAPAEAGQGRAQEAAIALARGNARQAVTLYDEALRDTSLPNERRASIHVDRGVANARLNLHKAAIDDFNRAVQLAPENAAVYNNRGNVLLALGLAKEALKDFDRAIVLAPGYAAAYNNRAQSQMKLGQPEVALADFSRAIQLMPTNAAPLNGRGRAQLALGRPYAATRDLNKALAVESRFGPAYRSRAEAKLAIERYEEAIEDLSRAIALDPGNVELLMLRGQAYLGAANPANAIKDFTRALELTPRSSPVLAARGLAHAKAEAHEEALADLAQAIELDPRFALAYAYRAWTYKQMQQPEPGAKDAERALRLDLQLAEAHWAQGELLEAGGRIDAAVVSLQQAVQLKPALREAVAALTRLGGSTGLEETVMPDLGHEAWSVVAAGRRFYARHAEHPRLKVPLEPIGQYQPKLVGWEEKDGQYKGLGVLRFIAGALDGKAGPEPLELAAIVDLTSNTLVAMQPVRQGDRLAKWTWDDSKLIVASADSGTEELSLRTTRAKEPPKVVVQAPVVSTPSRRVADAPSSSQAKSGVPAWAPWSQAGNSSGSGDGGGGGSSRSSGKKPKTLFDMLFGN